MVATDKVSYRLLFHHELFNNIYIYTKYFPIVRNDLWILIDKVNWICGLRDVIPKEEFHSEVRCWQRVPNDEYSVCLLQRKSGFLP